MTISFVTLNYTPVDLSIIDTRSGQFDKEELQILVSLAIGARGVLEIGVGPGQTAKAILTYDDTVIRYEGVDLVPKALQSPPLRSGFLINDNPRFTLILRKNGSLDLRAMDLFETDFVFIDGSKLEGTVANDSDLAYKVIRPRGMIVWRGFNKVRGVTDTINKLSVAGNNINVVNRTSIAYQLI